MRFNERDAELLVAFGRMASPEFPRIAQEFYDRLIAATNKDLLTEARERAIVFSEGELIEPDALPFETAPPTFAGIRIPGTTLAEIERYAILSTLEATEGSTTKAAEVLDISVRTIQYRLHDYGVPFGRVKS